MPTVSTVPFSLLIASDAINARAASKDGLDELAASIATKGLIQPLCVRPADDGRYEVIDGATTVYFGVVRPSAAGGADAGGHPERHDQDDIGSAIDRSRQAIVAYEMARTVAASEPFACDIDAAVEAWEGSLEARAVETGEDA